MKTLFHRYWPWSIIRRLRKALAAATDIGIYPKAIVNGPHAYEVRTPYMEGWNAANAAVLAAITKELEESDWE